MLHDKPSEIQQGIQDKLHGMRCTQPPKTKVKTILGLTQLHPRSQRQKR